MLPPGTQGGCRSGSLLVDGSTLVKLAGYAKKYGVITKLPDMKKLVPNNIPRPGPPGHGHEPAGFAGTRRQARDEAEPGPVQLRRHRQSNTRTSD